jgi:serine/threonine-protein kinase RsbW
MTRPKVRFCLVFERELVSVPVMRRVLGDTLRGIGVSAESVDDILLAATEACTNVVLHAGQAAPAYAVAATVDRAGCRVEVTDDGQGCGCPPGGLSPGMGDSPPPIGPPGPVSPGVRSVGPDGKKRHRIGPAEADERFIAGLAESGRGLAIMRACVDDVKLRTAPGRGTRVVLDKRLEWEGPLRRSA